MSLIMEVWRYLRTRQKFWLMPVLVMLLLLGALIVLTHGSALAPLIYTVW